MGKFHQKKINYGCLTLGNRNLAEIFDLYTGKGKLVRQAKLDKS